MFVSRVVKARGWRQTHAVSFSVGRGWGFASRCRRGHPQTKRSNGLRSAVPSRPRLAQFPDGNHWVASKRRRPRRSNAGRLVHGVGILYGVALHRKYHLLAPAGFHRSPARS
jgi:hypothetical protein